MSLIRPGQGRRKKAFVRKRPQWNDSVSDLDSYRASTEEIRQRKAAHKSQNHISVKLEKIRKEKQKERKGLNNVEARQVAILKEVLHDQEQLDDVLTKTDRMMAVVKDLFGDDAKKFTGHPNVTLVAGGGQSNSLPAAPEIRTRIEKLSESVMSQSALNDLTDNSSDDDDDGEDDLEGGGNHRGPPISFQPMLDLQRFHEFLHEEENRNSNAIPSASATSLTQGDVSHLQQLQQILLAREQGAGVEGVGLGAEGGDQTLSTISGHPAGTGVQLGQNDRQAAGGVQGPANSTRLMEALARGTGAQTPPNSARTDSSGRPGTPPARTALNDTGKVKKSRRRVQPAQPSLPSNAPPMTMTDMRKVLECLQAEIADFERRTGRRSNMDVQSSETFTGYTVSLVTAVTKLTHYMKETELRLQAEMMVREQLAQDVQQLAVTTDSITQEMIVTQEEYGKLANEFHRYRQQTQGEMALLQAQVLDLKHQLSARGSNHSTPGKAASAENEHVDENYTALPDHVTQTSAAVLLSPVVRKTRVHEDTQPAEAAKPKRQTSLVDIPSLVEHNASTQHHHHNHHQQQHQQQKATTAITIPSSSTTVSSTLPSGVGGGGDPPRLTQTLPVMATVSVPRPIPLVQSNVGVPLSLPGSQAAGPLAQSLSQSTAPHFSASLTHGAAAGMTASGQGVAPSSGSTSAREMTQAMETQIAELNRQHAQAQQRLQSLLVQQKSQHGQLKLFQEDEKGEERERGEGVGSEAGQQQSHSQLRQHLPPGNKRPVVQEGRVPSNVSPPISPISHRSERFITQPDPIQRLASMSREIKISMPAMDLEASPGSLNASL